MLELQFTPFPIIHTERLQLREVTLDDAPEMFRMRSNTEVMKYLGKPVAKNMQVIHDLIKQMIHGVEANTAIAWGICLKDNGNFIGTISYHQILKEHYRAEIGYQIMPEHWQKGLTGEAIKAVINHGFIHMKLHSIEANIDPLNVASRKLLLKNKFEKEAYFKENHFFNGTFVDSEIYSLLRSNWVAE